MKFLHDKRRAGVLALLSTLLGAAALFFGLGAAEATTPCTNTPGNDATLDAFGLASAGVSTESTTSFTNVWVCATPPGTSTEANVTDPNSGTPGKVVYSRHCDSHLTTCTTLVNWTGAEVGVPSTSTNAPLNGTTAGSGGSLGSGPGTCAYVNSSTPICPLGGITVAGVTVNEADLVPVVTPITPTPPCTGVNNTCVPAGGTVRIFQDRTAPTVSATTGVTGGTNTVDAYSTLNCVQVNASC